MNSRKQIKKIVCSLLILLISFILIMNKEVYSSSVDNPIVLEPTDSQYLELRAIRVNEIDGQDYQVICELWAHGLETTGFTFRITSDGTLQPSSLADNSYIADDSYTDSDLLCFQFENGLENNMDTLGTVKDGSSLLFMVGVLDDATTENQYIVEKDGVGKVLDSTTEDVLIGKMSFRSTTSTLEENAIGLQTSEEEMPKTGVKVMANAYDYYENQKIFQFTRQLVSTNAKLSNLTTNLKEITNFNRNTYEYTIQVPANENMITVFPTPEDEKAVVTINGEVVDITTGMEVSIKGFSEMNNIRNIEILVTAEDGITTQTYKIRVEKQGGFLQGKVATVNTTGTHYSTIKIFRSDQYIDWETTKSTELDDYTMEAAIDTEADGSFQLILPTGKYDILIDKPGYLDYIIEDVEIYQQHTTSIGTKQIKPGDVNKDGRVDPRDESELLIGYGAIAGTERYDIRLDYIEDGRVDPRDESTFLIYYGSLKIIE